ncbi:Uma2 family endonuclease [Thiocapsa bogorovii]|uniref:Uma2 family endonuclease n=1 Tax=Thiocapsa bogorovii TaxID=521689 RepID=UPI001E2CCB2F|nr:Uma2 family endonuclease [Thiocapsa bogorovii]UHD17866.1 Uma2 family endonuclease [Thiocapsa bogorovii]
MPDFAEARSMSAEEYLAVEAAASVRHEYVAGEVFAMAGASEEHATIAGNVFALLRSHVRGSDCRVYIADMKMRVEPASAFFYPDVFVTCDARDAAEPFAKRYARLIIEVLSESTEGYDRGAKFGDYRRLDTLEEYVLIDSRRRACEVFRRRPDGWLLEAPPENGRLVLHSIDFECPLDALYEDVSFPRSSTVDAV